mmetsp:Transcript_9811/g.29350  ORF Transcript_9811/g.29350 Transcript_9811/m.29350 type:complete len:255 (-) Transcript_9811:1373-2137(-)
MSVCTAEFFAVSRSWCAFSTLEHCAWSECLSLLASFSAARAAFTASRAWGFATLRSSFLRLVCASSTSTALRAASAFDSASSLAAQSARLASSSAVASACSVSASCSQASASASTIAAAKAFCWAFRRAVTTLPHASLAFFATDTAELTCLKAALKFCCASFTLSLFTGLASVFLKDSAKDTPASVRVCALVSSASRAASTLGWSLERVCSARCFSFSLFFSVTSAPFLAAAACAFVSSPSSSPNLALAACASA